MPSGVQFVGSVEDTPFETFAALMTKVPGQERRLGNFIVLFVDEKIYVNAGDEATVCLDIVAKR